MSQGRTRLILIEDEQLLLQTVAAWIQQQPDLHLDGCAEDGEEGYRLYLKMLPDIVVTDIDLPRWDGLLLAGQLLRQAHPVRILAMSGLTDPYTIWRVRQSGIHGYIEKMQGADSLMEAIRTVARGGTYFSPLFEQVKNQWLRQPEAFYKILSDREQQVLQCVVKGWDDKKTAAELGISAATASVHRKHVRRKLELHNDRELIAYAHLWGLDNQPHQAAALPIKGPKGAGLRLCGGSGGGRDRLAG